MKNIKYLSLVMSMMVIFLSVSCDSNRRPALRSDAPGLCSHQYNQCTVGCERFLNTEIQRDGTIGRSDTFYQSNYHSCIDNCYDTYEQCVESSPAQSNVYLSNEE